MEVECQYDERHSCYISPVLAFTDKISAKAVQIIIAIYPDAFDINLYCAGYMPDPENMKETMTFISLVNNILYPGTSIKYTPDGPLRLYRYVDCINTVGKAPSIQKVHTNLSIILSMYERVIDLALSVDMGYVSAIDAFNTLLKQ